MPRVCTVILNWNGCSNTLRCVEHVLRQDHVENTTVVVDNGSRDEDRVALEAGLPTRSRLIALPRNLGFAGGSNVGLRHALAGNCDYVWLVNNDAFPEADCLRTLVEAMEADARLAAVTPLLYGTDGKEQHAGGRVDWGKGWHHFLGAAELSTGQGFGTWVTGTALLLRASALRAVGLLDERLFAYWEDPDLCLRLGRAGYLVRAVPACGCLHLGNASTGGSDSPASLYLGARNGLRVLRKFLPWFRVISLTLAYWANMLDSAGRRYRCGEKAQAYAVVNGLLASVRAEVGFPEAAAAGRRLTRILAAHPVRLARGLRRLAGLFPAARAAQESGNLV
jgi:GT2 family glycosyltransferase